MNQKERIRKARTCMMWLTDDPQRMKRKDYKPAGDPVVYFINKYGYHPVHYAVGEGANIDGLDLSTMTEENFDIVPPKGCIILR